MKLTAIDQDQNLFLVQDILEPDLVQQILATDWLALPWTRGYLQETWKRRKIVSKNIPWFNEWTKTINQAWQEITIMLGDRGWGYPTYPDSNFWLDEPGFDCNIHVDGGLIGAMQLYWIGDIDTGTCFYNTKRLEDVRYKFDFLPNQGYLTVNKPTAENFSPLQWHAVPVAVRENTFRVSSYINVTCPPQPQMTL